MMISNLICHSRESGNLFRQVRRIPAFAGMTLILLISLFLLSACQTMTSSEKAAQHKKKVAAGINIQLGMAYLDKHEIQRAKQKFLKALRQDPQLPEVWYSMAYFFEVTGDNTRASESYLKALELAPKRGDTNNNYGTFLCRSHQYPAAVKHFVAATKDVEYLDVASAYENAGLCSELIPDRQAAIQYFEQALKQDPARPSSLFGLAEVNYQMGDYQAAQTYLKQFLLVTQATPESLALSEKLKKKGFAN